MECWLILGLFQLWPHKHILRVFDTVFQSDGYFMFATEWVFLKSPWLQWWCWWCPMQHWLWAGTLRWATWQATSPRPGWGSRTPRGLPSRWLSSNWSEKCHDSIMIIWYSDHIWWLEGRNMRNIMMLMWWSCVMTLSHLPQHCSLISIWRTTQIGSALEWIHSKGLCHLDVKLDNILVFRWLSWSSSWQWWWQWWWL